MNDYEYELLIEELLDNALESKPILSKYIQVLDFSGGMQIEVDWSMN